MWASGKRGTGRMALLTAFCAELQLTRCIIFRKNASVGRLALIYPALAVIFCDPPWLAEIKPRRVFS